MIESTMQPTRLSYVAQITHFWTREPSTVMKVIKYTIAMFTYPIALLGDIISRLLFGKEEEFFEETDRHYSPIRPFVILWATLILARIFVLPVISKVPYETSLVQKVVSTFFVFFSIHNIGGIGK